MCRADGDEVPDEGCGPRRLFEHGGVADAVEPLDSGPGNRRVALVGGRQPPLVPGAVDHHDRQAETGQPLRHGAFPQVGRGRPVRRGVAAVGHAAHVGDDLVRDPDRAGEGGGQPVPYGRVAKVAPLLGERSGDHTAKGMADHRRVAYAEPVEDGADAARLLRDAVAACRFRRTAVPEKVDPDDAVDTQHRHDGIPPAGGPGGAVDEHQRGRGRRPVLDDVDIPAVEPDDAVAGGLAKRSSHEVASPSRSRIRAASRPHRSSRAITLPSSSAGEAPSAACAVTGDSRTCTHRMFSPRTRTAPGRNPAARLPRCRPAAPLTTSGPSPNSTTNVTAGCGITRWSTGPGPRSWNPAMLMPATRLGRDGSATSHTTAASCSSTVDRIAPC